MKKEQEQNKTTEQAMSEQTRSEQTTSEQTTSTAKEGTKEKHECDECEYRMPFGNCFRDCEKYKGGSDNAED